MRLITGAILIAAAEQAFSHAHLIQFPHHDVAAEVLVPGSVVLLGLGLAFLVWGLWTELRGSRGGRVASPSVSP